MITSKRLSSIIVRRLFILFRSPKDQECDISLDFPLKFLLLDTRASPSLSLTNTLANCFASNSYDDNKFWNSSKYCYWSHPWIDVTNGVYSGFKPRTKILLIRASIASSGFNKDISQHKFLIFKKYSEIERLSWMVLANSFSNICNRDSFFMLNKRSRVRHISWADLDYIMWSNKPEEIVLFRMNSAFALTCFHFLYAQLFFGLSAEGLITFPLTTSHKSSPTRYCFA